MPVDAPASPALRRAGSACALAVAIAVAAAPAQSQTWHFEPSISLEETFTNNVNLDPTNARTADIVTAITPSLSFRERGAHTRLDGSVSIPIQFYARTGGENNYLYPTLALLGDLDLYQRIVHVEAAINVQQQFFTPFGAQPDGFTNATSNRYRTTTYRVSPYALGVASNGIEYELRNNNVWTNLSGAPISTQNSRFTEWIGRVSSPTGRQFGVGANYDYTDVTFDGEAGTLKTQIGRVIPFYNYDPQLRLDATVGYEDNQGTLSDYRGAVYGVGFRWRPTERTNVVGNWEHRFFGASYLLSFDHRTPRSIWNAQISRNITTYPQQLASLQGGTDVAGFVNGLYLSSIPDPVLRQQAVDQFLLERGLPNTLVGPVTLYGEQIILQQQQSATVGLTGARNTILFSVFNIRSEPISASGTPLPPILALGNDNTQTGGSIVWTNRLTQAVNLIASLEGFRTVANAPGSGTTTQGIARVTLAAPISPHMTGFIGARYQALNSDVASDYNEAAAFVGISYTLR
ncbi:MAG: TIGR03016 family PEP-CTERM system-associated outer membrane protein [Casimicrobiaceae bacterium]